MSSPAWQRHSRGEFSSIFPHGIFSRFSYAVFRPCGTHPSSDCRPRRVQTSASVVVAIKTSSEKLKFQTGPLDQRELSAAAMAKSSDHGGGIWPQTCDKNWCSGLTPDWQRVLPDHRLVWPSYMLVFQKGKKFYLLFIFIEGKL